MNGNFGAAWVEVLRADGTGSEDDIFFRYCGTPKLNRRLAGSFTKREAGAASSALDDYGGEVVLLFGAVREG
jgi:hypothetical protein